MGLDIGYKDLVSYLLWYIINCNGTESPEETPTQP